MVANDNDDRSKPPPGVPLLITRRQRAELHNLGFTEDDIRVMTPSDAHCHLADRTAKSASSEQD